mgnify:CR=1 FL=1|tara:strand:+ start:728 stop:1966 length:1239 start_codon:yes stop_codon:yes gene_type:complete
MIKNLENKIIILLFSFIPISMIIGQAISLANIFIVSIFLIIQIIRAKNFNFTSNTTFKFLLIIYAYLLFNIFISLDYNYSFFRNFGFFRLIFLFVAINFLFFNYKNQDLIFKIWSMVILLVIADSFIEYFSGKNIFGYGQDIYADRIVSFFKDEPIVAAYLNGFFFLILGFLLNFKKSNSSIFIICFFLTLLFLICVTITGERSNTIKALTGLCIFLLLNNKFNIKKRIITLLGIIILIFLMISNSDYLKYRYFDTIINPILNSDKRENFLKENIYVRHYKSGYAVFKNYPFFGVGNKNYRLETRSKIHEKKNYFPDTHPHQVYFELLSEHGLIGSVIFLSIIFFLIFRNIKLCLRSKNYLQLGAFCYLITTFSPIIPSGSFFSDFNITLFFLNFSIFYACNPKSNIFNKNS